MLALLKNKAFWSPLDRTPVLELGQQRKVFLILPDLLATLEASCLRVLSRCYSVTGTCCLSAALCCVLASSVSLPLDEFTSGNSNRIQHQDRASKTKQVLH